MNSISILNSMSMHLENPWLLFLIIPAIGLALFPYFRVPKQHRNTRNRVISLVIHCVILVFVVFMLAGLSFTFTQVSIKKDVILLVDASDSTSTSREEMDEFIDSVLNEVDKEHRVGIVTFGGDCIYAAEMDSDPRDVKEQYSQQQQKPVGEATDISGALKYARSLLSSPEDGRIIVLSDGRQTDNNAIATVRALSDEGVRVDSVYFPSSGNNVEAQISDVVVQVSGGSADVIVTVDSNVAQDAKLALYDEGELVFEQPIKLSGASDNFSFNHTVIDSRMHTIKLVLAPDRDTLTKNNTYYSYINLNSSTKVLLIDGSGNGVSDLRGIIDGTFDVTVKGLNELPKTVEELCEYGEVMLVNVSNADIHGNGFDDLLTEYVSSYGGGLYTVGGGRAYQEDDMKDQKFEALLPINANTDAKSLGLLLIIDSSGSMRETAKGTNMTRMELAKEAAIASVEELAKSNSNDYVGVISFNAKATVISDMASLDRKDVIIDRIKGIDTATGTYYSDALERANTLLTPFSSTELKHIIFLTDGEPVDPSENVIYEHVDRIARNDITISTIALGASVPTNIAREMANRGGGEFYDVTRESELINVMIQETTRAAGSYLNQGEFTPSIISHTPAVSGIREEDMPKLGGFYGTRLKSGATMVLGYKSNPIYAEWTVNNSGRVGSFMCDLEGVWSEEFMKSAEGIAFIKNSIASVISKREISNQTVSVDFSRDNYTVQTVVRAMLDDGENISAKLIDPDGEEIDLNLDKLSQARFASVFRADKPGVYTVRVTKSGEEYNAYMAFSYSNEYRAFADDNACFSFMESMSLEGKGSMLFTANKMFDEESEMTESESDPTIVLLIICAVLFLLDIVVRKFKIKLPHEIREERKARFVEGGNN